MQPAQTGGEPIGSGREPDTLQPEDPKAAAQACREALSPLAAADWSVLAGGLAWSCRYTLDHTANALQNYAMDLATLWPERGLPRPPGPDQPSVYPHLGNADLLRLIEARAAILAEVVKAAPPGVRGYHVWGRADPLGYAGMGCVEILIHADDVARGLGGTFHPPTDLCRRVVRRMFLWAPADAEPWAALRWATGRLELPGHGRLAPNWAWHNSTPEEWDGTRKSW